MPQQRQIWAESSVHTTAYGNARSLTHWVRPEIKPETSWFLVRFVFAEPRLALLFFLFWEVFFEWGGGLLLFRAVPIAYASSQVRVESELQLPAYPIAIAMWDLSQVRNLHHSSQQCWSLTLLSKARDWTCILRDTSQICFRWATIGTPNPSLILFSVSVFYY